MSGVLSERKSKNDCKLHQMTRKISSGCPLHVSCIFQKSGFLTVSE